MISIDWKNLHLFTAILDFKRRLVVLCLTFAGISVGFEVFIGWYLGFYIVSWNYLSVLIGFNLLFAFLLISKKIKTKSAANTMIVSALIWGVYTIYRIVSQDFNLILSLELLIGILSISFLFDRTRLIKTFCVFVGLAFLISLYWVDWSIGKHMSYVISIFFAFIFIGFAFIFKAFRIWMLRMAEIMLVKFDKYLIVFDRSGEVIFINPAMKKEFNLTDNDSFWKLGGYSEEKIKDRKLGIRKRIIVDGSSGIYEEFMENRLTEQVFVKWDFNVVGEKFLFAIGTNKTDEVERVLEHQKLSLVTKALNAGITIVAKDGKMLWCNESFCEIFGYTEEEIIGNKAVELFMIPTFFNAQFAALFEGGLERNVPHEIAHYRKDGSLVWILLSSTAIKNLHGEEEYVQVIVDITAQKLNEIKSNQISLIAKRTRSPVLITDLSSTITWVNSALLDEFGIAFEEIIGQNFIEYFIDEDENKGVQEKIHNCIKNSKSLNVEVQFVKSDEKHWFELSADPIEGHQGENNLYMFIMQNIQQLKMANELVEEKNNSIMDSINYALRIQKALLPEKKYLDSIFRDYFIYFKPKDIVSGDFYYVKSIRNKIFLAIADCTGHGVPGALVTAVCFAALDNAILNFQLDDPSEILHQVDDYVDEALSVTDKGIREGMDVGIIVLDPEKSNLLFSGARRSLFVFKAEEDDVTIIKGVKKSIGESILDFEVDFRTDVVEVNNQMNLYLYTDGICDQFGGVKNKKIMQKNIANFLNKNNQLSLSMPRQLEEVETFFKVWTSDFKIEQTDDMLLFGLSLTPEELVGLNNKEF